jgi:hypothetical protein
MRGESRVAFLLPIAAPVLGDLRKLDRHERTTLHGLIPLLSCRNCQPQPPFAKLVKLSQYEWQSANKPPYMRKRGL